MDLKIVRPSVEYKESYLQGVAEFQAEGLSWYLPLDLQEIAAHFDEHVQQLLDAQSRRSEKQVPETKYWGIYQGRYAGKISIRHELSDALRIMGGHIGYDTIPSLRRLGIGSRMLELALPHAREIGLDRVLITCNDDNEASIRIVEKNGGVLEKKALYEPDKRLKRYYWINL